LINKKFGRERVDIIKNVQKTDNPLSIILGFLYIIYFREIRNHYGTYGSCSPFPLENGSCLQQWMLKCLVEIL